MLKLRKYFLLYIAFFRTSFQADIEYRVNFIMRIITDIFWFLAQIILFEVIYRYVDQLGSWNVDQTRVFLGVLFIVDGLYMVLFSNNMDQLSEKIRNGQLDLLLTKPVDSLFMLCLQKVNVLVIFNFTFAVGWLVWALSRLPGEFNYFHLVQFLVLIPCGVFVVFACRFFFSAISIFYTATENLQYVWFQLYKLGTRPDTIYFPWLRVLLWTVLPVGMIASVPSRALLGEINPLLFIWSFIMFGLSFISLRVFWRYALKNYSSASS